MTLVSALGANGTNTVHQVPNTGTQVPDTGTQVLDNAGPFLGSSIVSFWITLSPSKGHKYHIFKQYFYTRNVPVFTNIGTFQYLGPKVYFFNNNKNTLPERFMQDVMEQVSAAIFNRIRYAFGSSFDT